MKNTFNILRYMVGSLGIFVSALLIPPLFSRYLAMSSLMKGETIALLVVEGFVLMVSLSILVTKLKVRAELVLLFLGVLFVISLEMATRAYIIYFRPSEKAQYAYLANRTYPEFMAYVGHPFLHFTGNPGVALVGNKSIGDLPPFNNLGFMGKDFVYEKKPNVIRIAALGGSTTLDGYPKILEDYLNSNKGSIPYTFEVMNFGLAYYTSTHSLVNFVLNVVDFSPDYVIFHHAWNDSFARNAVNFRTDYSHAFKSFHEAEIPDKYPLRVSVLYRFLKKTFVNVPAQWEDLGNAIGRGRSTKWNNTEDHMGNLNELKPYIRNIKTIIQLSDLRGIKVILTTQPHSTDSGTLYYNDYISKHMEQCNTIVRTIYNEYHESTLFVDLDDQMTGHMNNVFHDFGHMDREGILYKAEQIGKMILANLKSTQSLTSRTR